MALAKDDSIMFAPTPKPKAPTSFLSLPRELRQKILYLSRGIFAMIDSYINPNYCRRATYDQINKEVCQTENSEFALWREKLLLVEFSGVIALDMDYLHRKWVNDVDQLYNRSQHWLFRLRFRSRHAMAWARTMELEMTWLQNNIVLIV